MFNQTLSMLHNLIFHLVAVDRDAQFQIQILRASAPNDNARKLLNVKTSMTEENQRVLSIIVFGGKNVCKEMDLPATDIAISALKRLENKAGVHIEDFVSGVKAVSEALWRELPQQYIYCYPKAKTNVLKSLNSETWSLIFRKMPALESDIRAGIHCWTFGENVAAIYHIMRAMEIGVQKFAKRLGVKLVKISPGKTASELTWHQLLDAMNPAIRLLDQGSVFQKRRAEKFNAAQSYLYGVKNAWRNPTMHPRSSGYKDEEVLDIFSQMRGFLLELASV